MTEINGKARGSGRVPLGSLGYAYALLVAVLAAFGLHAVFVDGRAVRAAAHDDVLRTIADEDRHFCEMFGMPFGTDAYAACSRELSNVRQRQVDRENAVAAGIL